MFIRCTQQYVYLLPSMNIIKTEKKEAILFAKLPQIECLLCNKQSTYINPIWSPCYPFKSYTWANIWRTMVQRCKMSCPRGYILKVVKTAYKPEIIDYSST